MAFKTKTMDRNEYQNKAKMITSCNLQSAKMITDVQVITHIGSDNRFGADIYSF